MTASLRSAPLETRVEAYCSVTNVHVVNFDKSSSAEPVTEVWLPVILLYLQKVLPFLFGEC